jgi:predicted patatin/cPLA2 family phospholipase
VYTSGVLEAFDDAGLRFDTVVACSAGACAAASFLAGQTWRNRRVYLDFLDGKKLVRFSRLWTGGNVMDIDYFIDDVTLRLCPLDLRSLRTSATTLHIAVTDWKSGDVRYLNNHEDDILTALRATCALPFFYRGEVRYQGRRYVDGGVADPVPIARAIELGAREIVVVLTSPIEARGRNRRWIPGAERLLSPSKALRLALRDRYLRYQAAAAIVDAPPEGVTIRVVRPTRALPVKRTTTVRALLERGCDLGREDGDAFVTTRTLAVESIA